MFLVFSKGQGGEVYVPQATKFQDWSRENGDKWYGKSRWQVTTVVT